MVHLRLHHRYDSLAPKTHRHRSRLVTAGFGQTRALVTWNTPVPRMPAPQGLCPPHTRDMRLLEQVNGRDLHNVEFGVVLLGPGLSAIFFSKFRCGLCVREQSRLIEARKACTDVR